MLIKNTSFPDSLAKWSYKETPLILAPVTAVPMETAMMAQSLQSSSSSRSGTACASNSLFPAVPFLPSAFLPVSCDECDCLLSPLEILKFLLVSGFRSSWLSLALSEPSPSPVWSSTASLLSIFKAEFSCSSSFLEATGEKKEIFVNRLF